MRNFINAIELIDGSNSEFNSLAVDEIILEAPLGKAYGCVDLVIIGEKYCVLCEVKPDSYNKVQKRLEKQIPRYQAAIQRAGSSSESELVQRIYSIVSSKETYLISATNDATFPNGLKEMYRSLPGVDLKKVGWISYSQIVSALSCHGYEISGNSPNIWAHPKSGKSPEDRFQP